MFSLFAIIVAFVVILVMYLKMYEKWNSYSAFDNAARREISNIKNNDTSITCEFCGGEFDYRINSVCPHCGADYSKNAEQLKRHDIDENLVNERANQEMERARERTGRTLKSLKIALIILGIIFVINLLGEGLLFAIVLSNGEFSSTDSTVVNEQTEEFGDYDDDASSYFDDSDYPYDYSYFEDDNSK